MNVENDTKILKEAAWQVRMNRQLNQMNQTELAELLNAKQGTISSIESGKRNLSLKTLDSIARAMGMEVHVEFRATDVKAP